MNRQPIALRLEAPIPEEVNAGAQVALDVAGVCLDGSDLAGRHCRLQDSESGTIIDAEFEARPNAPCVAKFRFAAPNLVGDFRARVITAGSAAANPLEIKFKVKAHTTSLAAWDIVSPQRVDETFKVIAGATCSCGCDLAGHAIEIRDGSDVVAQGVLNETPWSGTRALYWAELRLTAPRTPGTRTWDVHFTADGLTAPHRPARCQIGVHVVPPPECRVAIRVIDETTSAPLPNTRVQFGSYSADTGQDGFVRFDVAKGTFELDVLKQGYDVPPARVAVSGNIDLPVAMRALPKTNADNYWYHGTPV